ncbi:interferon regulatory factor 4-like [Solea senegalensis]|uniref:Interferon regulatory factor 4-like n=1 Tax=Solea senegalensis TaxID=28829 RepID=A0AAV6SNS0_SOLSE|nr:interferon regulatory factor 10 [Solea senegalensis]KAG7519051.1 interferon regulatory factor 4-like [Solea senegalensis]
MVEGAKLHLKEWLIRQIESATFDGLCWEDDAKTMFRIPWKHAAKKDYNQMEDAALFKAWAEYKGKYKEGRDKPDPTMWKTRLRCALNKSTDFQEVPDRNQLDISEPYKVYRILPDNGSARPVESPLVKDRVINQVKRSPKRQVCENKQPRFNNESFQVNEEEKPWTADPMKEHMYCELTGRKKQNQAPASITLLQPGLNVSDVRMQVTLLYQGQKVMEMTTTSPDGCFILQGQVPLGNERIYGPCTAQRLPFPSPNSVSLPPRMTEAMNCLLCHLERGVLLWVAQDGVFIKRFCQGRVYWSGPMAQHADRPNKLEREKTFKLLDIPKFISELQNCLQGKGTKPSYKVELCFGEEYPDPNIPRSRKLIIAQVVPLFAVELLQKFNLGETEEKQSALGSDTAGDQV